MAFIKNPFQETINKKLEAEIKELFKKHDIKTRYMAVTGNRDFNCIFEEDLTKEQEAVVVKLMKRLYPKGNWGFRDVNLKENIQ